MHDLPPELQPRTPREKWLYRIVYWASIAVTAALIWLYIRTK